MNGGSLNLVTSTPLARPRTPPTTTPIRMAGTIGTPETSSWAVTAPASPRMDPTDRSMPPVRMTMS